MSDIPIIFSGAMIRALLAGRKTQTRRLATSPLRRCALGDRLYVREGFRVGYGTYEYREDLGRCPKPKEFDPATTALEYLADGDHELGGPTYPSIHLPRWASRLTLIVENVRVELLQSISEADAWAEGVCAAVEHSEKQRGLPPFGDLDIDDRHRIVEQIFGSAVNAYRWLWESLHGAGSWDAPVDVVALTFGVIHSNIDRISA